MIGPEVHQPFCKGPGSDRGTLRARQHLRPVVRLVGVAHGIEGELRIGRGCRLALHFLALLARPHQRRIDLIGGAQGCLDGQGNGTLDLRGQPGAGIRCGRTDLARPCAQAEAQHRYFRLHHVNGNGKEPRALTSGSQPV